MFGPQPDYKNLGTAISGDLYFQTRDENQFQYYLDLKMDGSFVNSSTAIAPVSLSVNQLYALIPFSEESYLYFGKKMKEIGVSNFFNVSNRISPKFLSNYIYSRKALGLVELDELPSDKFNYGLILSFQDAENWDEIQHTVYTNNRIGNFNMENYLYFQKNDDRFWGLDLSYQVGIHQFYLESVLKKHAEQKIITGNTGTLDDFSVRDTENVPATVLGWSVSKDNFSSAVEYMYRDEG
ncbi:MAG TPA: hypothetical protein VHY08_10080, partial [Bacillota bacterium]|nr:hypothetical protein [Bacillota bacterium]